MGITYKIDAEAGVIFSVAEGEIGVADIRELRERFTADPLYHPNLASLFDGRSARITYSGDEARSMADWAKQNRPTAKMAFLIDPQSQGFFRMTVAWGGENRLIFYDMASAREWLGLSPEEE